MKDWEKRYRNRFIWGMLGYGALLTTSLLLLGNGVMTNRLLAAVVALVPVLPLLYAMAAVVGNARHQDEFRQRVHFEAVLITALLTGGLTFSYGLLEAAGLVPHLPTLLIAPFMIVVWGVSNALILRRYD